MGIFKHSKVKGKRGHHQLENLFRNALLLEQHFIID